MMNYQDKTKDELIKELQNLQLKYDTLKATHSKDITERKQAEEKLFRLEQKSRAWLENSPACTKIVDLDFNLQYMSNAGLKGLQIDDITPYYGKPYPFHFYPESFKTEMTGNMIQAKETGKIITQEAPVVDINGNEVWFHSTIVPLKDHNEKVDYLLIVSMDITERKLAVENLSIITSNTPNHIIMQDNKLRYTFVLNPQLGLTEEQYIGRSDFEIGLSEKDAVHLTSIKRKVLETCNPVKVEVPLKNLSGNTEYFDGSFIPRFDTNGKVNGLIGYFRNVTIQKKSIKRIKEYQKKLLSLTRHLEEVRENERAQIAMNLHDDLGQRITALNLDLGWMKSRMGVQSQGVRKKIEEMSQSIIETIESIKEVSSFLRPSILFELGLIPAFIWQLKKFEKQSGLKCHFTFMPEEFRIDDHISLIIYRVLQESLTNIIRHSEASIVEIVLVYKKNTIELTIKDNGVGIDNNKVNSLSSMGIAGLMERVRSVSGTLSVVGVKGAGTTLKASIPLKKKKNHD